MENKKGIQLVVPKKELEEQNSGNSYLRQGMVWKPETLWKFAEEKGYEVRDLPLWTVNICDLPWQIHTLRDFIREMHHVNQCTFDYPIIIDNMGIIADGMHRVVKAFLEGKETIKAIRLEEMPEPDDYLR